MLQQPHGLAIDQRRHHIAQHGPDGIEPLVRLTDVLQPQVVEQNLLHDENRDRLGQFRSSLHDAQAQWDDLGREEEVDHVRIVILLVSISTPHACIACYTHLDERTDDAERGQTKVLERPGLAGRVQEWVQEEWDVCYRDEQSGRETHNVPFKKRLLVSA
jgi:hypothetical protein